MRIIGRLIGLAWLGLVIAAVCGTIAARAAKRRIVTIDAPEADEVSLAAIFEPLSFRSTAPSFRGGSIECWYGGGVIDLRGATLDPDGAHLQTKAVFGGAQILVPETWTITSRVLGIGGLGDARPKIERPEDAPHLTIEGTAIFGGFGIMSELPEAAARGFDEAVARVAARKHHGTEPGPDAPSQAPEPEMATTA